jgi:hypothetical protein
MRCPVSLLAASTALGISYSQTTFSCERLAQRERESSTQEGHCL